MLPDPADPAATELRLRRLEDSLANLQNAEWLAEHVADRVSERLQERLALNGATLPQAKVSAAPVTEPIPAAPADEQHTWFLPALVREARAMVRMFFDPRYRVNLVTWMAVLFTLPLVLLSGWWFPGAYIPLVGPYLDKLLDLIIAFMAYKALAREARRYQQFRGDR